VATTNDQNAEVEVRGDYLFGQPVKRLTCE
jgi:hypothetical protein